nr:polygalacturonase-like isoform X1 [Leptinotarsa decemlineata]
MFFAKVISILSIHSAISITAWGSAISGGCTITEFSQVSQVVNSCTNIVVKNLNVPAQQTLHMKLKKESTLSFEGTTIFGVANWEGPLIKIEGDTVKIDGAEGSKFDGQGAEYWDGKGGQGSKKPLFFTFQGSGELTNINLLNCPERCSDVHGSHITIDHWNIDVSAGDKNNLGHNTDGIGVWGENIIVKNSVVRNQDDCFVMARGRDIHVSNLYCSGGHGISMSVGLSKTSFESNFVQNVTFKDITLVNSDNGIHLKTHKDGGPGLVEHITYKNITLKGIRRYGIEIQQDYPENDGKPTDNIPIRDVTVIGVRGTMTGKHSVPVRVSCSTGACANWNWSEVDIKGNHKPCSMNFKPNGFSC